MKSNQLEIVLINSQDMTEYPEREVEGVKYIVAKPDESYYVKVQLYNTDDKFTEHCHQVRLYVDGKKISYTYVARPTLFKDGVYTCIFKGFKTPSGHYQAFQFVKTLDSNRSSITTTNEKTGTVEVEVLLSESKGVPSGMMTSSDGDCSQITLIEQIKFWRQSSLFTTKGEVGERVITSRMFFNAIGPPVMSAMVKYHTESTLNLLQTAGTNITMAPLKPKARKITDLTEEEPASKSKKVLITGSSSDYDRNEVSWSESSSSCGESVIDLVSD